MTVDIMASVSGKRMSLTAAISYQCQTQRLMSEFHMIILRPDVFAVAVSNCSETLCSVGLGTQSLTNSRCLRLLCGFGKNVKTFTALTPEQKIDTKVKADSPADRAAESLKMIPTYNLNCRNRQIRERV